MVASPRKSRATDPVANQLLNKYLKRMGSIPLLSRADEIEVSRRVREGGPESELAKVALALYFSLYVNQVKHERYW